MPLMTYEEYEKTRHSTPYYLVLQSGSRFLYYFGERHSFDPEHPQWQGEKKFWKEFLERTTNSKRIVFIEGGKRPDEANEEPSIINNGGMGLATYLAKQEDIETHSPEPNEAYERAELEKHFSRTHIQYYYFARVVHQWGNKHDPKPDFEEYINGYLETDKRESGWPDFDFSLDNMKKIHNDIFDMPFDESDSQFFYNAVNPVVVQTVVNKVSRMSSEIRDTYIVREIQKYMNDGFSIFAQFGCSHVVMQEPLLREVLNESNPQSEE